MKWLVGGAAAVLLGALVFLGVSIWSWNEDRLANQEVACELFAIRLAEGEDPGPLPPGCSKADVWEYGKEYLSPYGGTP